MSNWRAICLRVSSQFLPPVRSMSRDPTTTACNQPVELLRAPDLHALQTPGDVVAHDLRTRASTAWKSLIFSRIGSPTLRTHPRSPRSSSATPPACREVRDAAPVRLELGELLPRLDNPSRPPPALDQRRPAPAQRHSWTSPPESRAGPRAHRLHLLDEDGPDCRGERDPERRPPPRATGPTSLPFNPERATPPPSRSPHQFPSRRPRSHPAFKNAGGPPIFASRNPPIASLPQTPAARNPLMNALATTGAALRGLVSDDRDRLLERLPEPSSRAARTSPRP